MPTEKNYEMEIPAEQVVTLGADEKSASKST